MLLTGSILQAGLTAAVAAMNVILATTNAIVDEWNEYIARLTRSIRILNSLTLMTNMAI